MDSKTYPVTHSEEEWRRILTPEQYAVMRQHGTEAPGSCALLWEKRPGKFTCAGCGQSLFESKLKFESGTGWPSFNVPLKVPWGPRPTIVTAWSAPRFTARIAAAISGMSLMTARLRPISDTASTVSR